MFHRTLRSGGTGKRPLKFATLAPFLLALVLAGCASPPPPSPMVVIPAGGGLAHGIDLPTDASDVLGELRGFKLDFVARYYRDPASRWPTLTAAELERLSALGVKIVTVWESHSGRPDYFSYASGYNDALSAYRQAKNVAQPAGSAIYFAVDFNARNTDLLQVDQYFRGVAAGFYAARAGRPEYKVGVYGSGAVCDLVKREHLAQYSWLSGSTAWEGTSDYADWSIRQAAQGARFPNLSFSHDANEARNDYGGFQLGNDANPSAAIVTVAATVPATVAAVVSGAVGAAVPAQASSTPVPPAPSIAPPAPATTALAAATGPTPTPVPVSAAPNAVPAAPGTPRPVAAAAEVAALAIAEPAATAAPLPAARAISQPVVEPQRPQSGSRSSEHGTAHDGETHGRSAAQLAKEMAGSKRGVEHVAVNGRAVVAPLRHGEGSPLARSHGPDHPDHQVSTTRRLGDHGAHPQVGKSKAVHQINQPTRRNDEQRHPVRSHHAADT